MVQKLKNCFKKCRDLALSSGKIEQFGNLPQVKDLKNSMSYMRRMAKMWQG